MMMLTWARLVAIVEHPADANTLLIAHAKGSLLEYNLAKQMVDKLYLPASDDFTIVCSLSLSLSLSL